MNESDVVFPGAKGTAQEVLDQIVTWFKRKAPILKGENSNKSAQVKLASSLGRIVQAHQSKRAAGKVKVDELGEDRVRLVALIKSKGLGFSKAWDGLNGYILSFSAPRGMSALALANVLKNPIVRWISFDSTSAQSMNLTAGGSSGVTWKITRKDFSKFLQDVAAKPHLNFKELNVGC